MYASTARKLWKRARLFMGLFSGMLLTSLPLHAQPTLAWTLAGSLGGAGTDIGQAIKTDRDGNTYVTGAFSETAYFPQVNGPRKMLTSSGGTDVFLAKYDLSGKLLWLVDAGGSEDDQGFDIAFDAARNIYVAGTFTDSATFHGTQHSEKTVTGNSQSIFLAKYNPAGVLLWVQTGVADYGGSNNGFGVAVDPAAGSVYLTGFGQGDITFSTTNGATPVVPGVGTWHMFLVKYDTAGHFKWGQTNEADPNTVAHKVALDDAGNVYAVGWMEGQAIFHSNDGHDLTVTGFSQPVQSYPDYPGDAFVVKYDSKGNAKWVNHVGGYKGLATEVATSHDGRVSITGFVGNIADSPEQASTIVTSQPGGKNINLGGGIFTVPFNRDVFFATYNQSGVLLDARRYGGALDDGGSGLAYDSHNNLVLAGIFSDSINIEGHKLTGKDPTSLFVAQFTGDRHDGLHRPDWVTSADGPGVSGLENDPRIDLFGGEVLVTGAFAPTARFDNTRLISAGDEDGFIAVLRPLKPHE